jgi:hypothetical protein
MACREPEPHAREYVMRSRVRTPANFCVLKAKRNQCKCLLSAPRASLGGPDSACSLTRGGEIVQRCYAITRPDPCKFLRTKSLAKPMQMLAFRSQSIPGRSRQRLQPHERSRNRPNGMLAVRLTGRRIRSFVRRKRKTDSVAHASGPPYFARTHGSRMAAYVKLVYIYSSYDPWG